VICLRQDTALFHHHSVFSQQADLYKGDLLFVRQHDVPGTGEPFAVLQSRIYTVAFAQELHKKAPGAFGFPPEQFGNARSR